MFADAAAWTRKAGFSWVLGATLALSSLGVPAREVARDGGSTVIARSELPIQGQQTHALILAGGPFPYAKDGSVFGNRERLLPPSKRGYYREYTVRTPGVRHRGARRIVCGGPQQQPEACYYTANHYASFRRIVD
ncbi:MAG: ribonuclease [Burkholderiaceae bacterium]|nr:ribonuclease [Burkholderiaceae bacterium]